MAKPHEKKKIKKLFHVGFEIELLLVETEFTKITAEVHFFSKQIFISISKYFVSKWDKSVVI